MKKISLFVLGFMVVFSVFACNFFGVTIIYGVTTTPTDTLTPTATVTPVFTQTNTLISTPTNVPAYMVTLFPTSTPSGLSLHNASYIELQEFINIDNTYQNTYFVDSYMCVQFSQDFVNNAHQAGINAYLVAVSFTNNRGGHAFVAFPLNDNSVVYIESQNSNQLLPPVVGSALCFASDTAQCLTDANGSKEIVNSIIYQAVCDRLTNECN